MKFLHGHSLEHLENLRDDASIELEYVVNVFYDAQFGHYVLVHTKPE